MAGNLPVPNGVQSRIYWTFGGTPQAINVLHFAKVGAITIDQTKANAIDTLMKASFTASLLAGQIHPNVSLQAVRTRDMASGENPDFIGAGAPTPGTGTGDPLPAATSLVISLLTAKRGTSFRGRVYLWGFTEAANDTAGGASTAAGTAATAFVSSILANMLGQQQLQLSVLTRWERLPLALVSTERNPPLLTTVTSVTTKDLRWDVQRRRAIPGI